MKLGGGVLGRGGLEGRRKERKLEIEEDDEAAMDEVSPTANADDNHNIQLICWQNERNTKSLSKN